VWRSLAEAARAGALTELTELTVQTNLGPIDLSRCLGRRWRKQRPDFWQALSPLGVTKGPAAATGPAAEPAPEPAPIASAPRAIERMREQLLAEARRDIEAASGFGGGG